MEVRSATAMAGYLPDEATAAAFDDGWYRTGDVGWLEPGGWVHLTDRCKEMIKVSGFQVAPAEIEAVLHAHPAVADCAVFGVTDVRAGEVPVAAVQLAPDADDHPRGAAGSGDGEARRGTSDCTTSSSSTRCRGRRRARCCAEHCATSGLLASHRRPPGRTEWTSACRPSRSHSATPRHRSWTGSVRPPSPSSMTPNGRPSSMPPWRRQVGASCGRRPTTEIRGLRRWRSR